MIRINHKIYGNGRAVTDRRKGKPVVRTLRNCRDQEKLYRMVLEEIYATIDSRQNSVVREDIAVKHGIEPGCLVKVFHRLVREGILYTRRHRKAHDTNRNSFFGGSDSGWASDLFEIRRDPRIEEPERAL